MIAFRQAAPGDEDVILRVMAGAFNRTEGSSKYLRDERRTRSDLDDHFVLDKNGAIVGALHLTTDSIQIGNCVISKAEIGEVCIAPELQGEGLGTRLMEEIVAFVQQRGDHVSRLGGYRRFYERFGWEPFPRGYIEFALSGLTSRGGFTDPVTYLDDPAEDAKIRSYNGRTDKQACETLYRCFNEGRTGARPDRSFSSDKAEDPWHVVYVENGEALAYLRASENPGPHTRFGTAVSIQDAASDPSDPRPLGQLLRCTLRRATVAGADQVSARLPLDHRLYDLYRDSSTGFVPTLWQSSEGGNMWQILNLRRLSETIRSELESRLTGRLATEVGIEVSGEAVGFVWDGNELYIGEAGRVVEMSQAVFGQLLLGLRTTDQLLPSATREDRDALSLLFPPQPTATGVWG